MLAAAAAELAAGTALGAATSAAGATADGWGCGCGCGLFSLREQANAETTTRDVTTLIE